MTHVATPCLMLLVLAPILAQAANPAHSPVHVVWNKTPIQVTLPINTERLIEFPAPITELSVPPAIDAPASRIMLTPDGRLYWLAHQGWERQRVIAQAADGYLYLLDVAADENGLAHPLIIEVAKAQDARQPPDRVAQTDYDYVDLARFAAQHMHGPARLIKPLPGVVRIPVHADPVPAVRGGQVITTPVAQWRAPKPVRYVTALKVINAMNYPVPLIPLAFRGEWLFFAPHHPVVNPAGDRGDSSFIYLVSAQPFDIALGVKPPRRAAGPAVSPDATQEGAADE